MFPQAIRAVRESRPKAFIFENVKGLTRAAFRNYFEYIKLQLTHPDIERRDGEAWLSHLARLEQRGQAQIQEPEPTRAKKLTTRAGPERRTSFHQSSHVARLTLGRVFDVRAARRGATQSKFNRSGARWGPKNQSETGNEWRQALL